MDDKTKTKNQKTFKPRSFTFETGVTLYINEDSVLLKDEEGSESIDFQHLDDFSYQEYWEPRIEQFEAWARIFIILVIFIISSEFLLEGWSVGSWDYLKVMIAVSFIWFLVVFFDGVFSLNILQGFIRKFYSDDFYIVTIGNKSGKNMDFITLLGEKNKLREIDKILTSLKSTISSKAKRSIKPNNETAQNSNYIDELKKLGELYNSGVLTEDEFKNKKQELLNK